MRTKLLFISVFFLLLCSLLTGEVIRVGIYDNPPKIALSKDGTPIGVWVEITNYIALQENWDVEYVYDTFYNHLNNLKSGKIDILVDTGITEERKNEYAFSEHVLVSWFQLYSKKSTLIKSLYDLEGLRVAGMQGSLNLESKDGLKELVNKLEINCDIIEYETYLETFQALERDSVDAVITNKDYGNYVAEKMNFIVAPIHLKPYKLAYSMYLDSPKTARILPILNSRITKIKKYDNSILYTSIKNHLGAKDRYKVMLRWVFALTASIAIIVLVSILISYLLKRKIALKTKELNTQFEKMVHSEIRLKEIANQWQTTFDSISDSICLLDRDSKIVQYNKATLKMLELEGDEIINIKCYQAFHGRSSKFPACPAEKLKVTLQKESMIFHANDKWLEVTVNPVLNEDSHLTGIVHVVRDITHQKQIEGDLKEKTNFLNTIIETASVSMWISDSEGTLISMNPACRSFFGTTEDEVVGKYNLYKDNIVRDNDLIKNIDQVFKNGHKTEFIIDYNFKEVAHVSPVNGTHKIVKTIITPVVNSEDKVDNAIVQAIDLTEIKKAERELEEHSNMLEDTVKARTRELEEKNEELERFNKLFIGREFRIKELRERIEYLEDKLKNQ